MKDRNILVHFCSFWLSPMVSMLPNTCGRSLLHRAVVFLNCGR
jgi:hypothetical protein